MRKLLLAFLLLCSTVANAAVVDIDFDIKCTQFTGVVLIGFEWAFGLESCVSVDHDVSLSLLDGITPSTVVCR